VLGAGAVDAVVVSGTLGRGAGSVRAISRDRAGVVGVLRAGRRAGAAGIVDADVARGADIGAAAATGGPFGAAAGAGVITPSDSLTGVAAPPAGAAAGVATGAAAAGAGAPCRTAM
jgi:hypothetical protein